MGPIELADQVGLDICLHVAESLKASLDRPIPDVSQGLRNKVEKGELGRKTGKGFYAWKDGEAVKDRNAPPPTSEMTDRLILPMLDACVTCLREGVVADEDTIDGAMIFATGFAPFRGGPCITPARAGSPQRTRAAGQHYGDRFRPDPGWDRLHMRAAAGAPLVFDDADRFADAIVARVGKKIVLALPLGLGKANHVANALFARAAADASIDLRIFTALTLGEAARQIAAGAAFP